MAMAENGRRETAGKNHRQTRRQLMAGGAGALGAVAVASLARAAPAAASNGQPIIMGQGNQSTSNTFINDNSGDTTFSALASSSGTALEGDAVDGTGVAGSSSAGIGVSGVSASSAANASAVYGEITNTSPGAFSAAVRGKNDGTGGTGIGVYGSQAGAGWGVYGTSVSGIGVNATGGSGIGVAGSGATGVFAEGTTGVHGVSSSSAGMGILAENTAGGQALKVNGVAAFSRSGVATALTGHSSVSVSLPLSSASFALATIQGNVTGLNVQGVTIVTGSPGSFTIHLNKTVAAKTKVAWLVVN
jgi:hypothetical protein